MIALEMERAALRMLQHRLEGAAPHEIIEEALASTRPGKLAVVSSFGTESAALLALVAGIDKSVPVLFLDTGWLFEETLRYRDEITARLGLTDVRALSPSPEALSLRDPERDLWFTDPDACCNLRKVQPLSRALADFDAWLTGRKRYQGNERSRLPAVEADGEKLKFNPFAYIAREEIGEIFRAHDLPPHPLEAKGFASVGCMACTSRVAPGEDQRAGRWRGRDKTECGIHTPRGGAGA